MDKGEERSVNQSLSELRQLEEERLALEAEQERLRREAAEQERMQERLERDRKREQERAALRRAEEEQERAEAAAAERAKFLNVERRLAEQERDLRREFDLERDHIRTQAVREAKIAPWKIAGPAIGVAMLAILVAALLVTSARSERDRARLAMMQSEAAISRNIRELMRKLRASDDARARLEREFQSAMRSEIAPAASVQKAPRIRAPRPPIKRDEPFIPSPDLSSDDPIRGIE